MPRPKPQSTGRAMVLGKLAERAGMSIEDWTAHLQMQELQRMKTESPDEYLALTEEIMSELLSENSPTAGASRHREAPVGEYKDCPACQQNLFQNQFTKGQTICKKCALDQERKNVNAQLEGNGQNRKRAHV